MTVKIRPKSKNDPTSNIIITMDNWSARGTYSVTGCDSLNHSYPLHFCTRRQKHKSAAKVAIVHNTSLTSAHNYECLQTHTCFSGYLVRLMHISFMLKDTRGWVQPPKSAPTKQKRQLNLQYSPSIYHLLCRLTTSEHLVQTWTPTHTSRPLLYHCQTAAEPEPVIKILVCCSHFRSLFTFH